MTKECGGVCVVSPSGVPSKRSNRNMPGAYCSNQFKNWLPTEVAQAAKRAFFYGLFADV